MPNVLFSADPHYGHASMLTKAHRPHGSVTEMDDALVDLCKRGLITSEEAYARAEQKQDVKERLKT